MIRAALTLGLLLAVLLLGLSAASLAQTTENTIDVPRPAPGETVIILVPPNTTLVLPVNPEDAVLESAGQDLRMTLDDGGRILLKYLLADAQLASAFLSFEGLEITAQAIKEQLRARDIEDEVRNIQEALLSDEYDAISEVAPAAAGPPMANGDGPQPHLAGLRHTGRDLLFPGEDERPGHPLYSYLLFAGTSEGNREERLRFNRAMEAFVGQIRSAEDLESRGAARAEINIFYAPMEPIFEDTTPENMRLYFAQRSGSEQIALLQDLYDHARAEVLLGRMMLSGDGPFIVSVLKPLSKHPARESEAFLVQDLSSVPPELVALWIEEFKRQVVREATDSPEHLRRLALSLRTRIAVLAEAFSITKSAVAEMFEAPEGPGGGGN